MPVVDMDERFSSKVMQTPDGCWLWTAAIGGRGYGAYKTCGKVIPAHRYAYQQLAGPIPDGLQIDHLCRVRSCVNPDHLEPVTLKVNVLRGVGAGATNKRKTRCVHGHEDWYQFSGRRECRSCRVQRHRTKETVL